MSRLAVWAVHLLTASGAALALIAAIGVARADWKLVFLSLGAALIIDGIDGTLARRLHVKERVPWFDGGTLDFVVDYATYVFVPAMIVAEAGIASQPAATIAGIVVVIMGALYFADKRMKTPEQAFRGFPAIWNTLVFLLVAYRPPEIVSLAAIVAAAALTFAPIDFIHPIRVVRLRPVTLTATVAWAVLAGITVFSDMRPGVPILVALGIVSFYLATIGIVLQVLRLKGRG